MSNRDIQYNRQQVAEFAQTISNVITAVRSRGFVSTLITHDTRFEGLGEVAEELNREFRFQARQSLNELSSPRTRDWDAGEVCAAKIEEIESMLDTLCKAHRMEVPKPTLDVSRVHEVPEFLRKVSDELHPDKMLKLNTFLSRQETDIFDLRTAYDREFFSALGMYMKGRDTLANETGSPEFEGLLKKHAGRGPEYFTKGYPHDLLVHDRLQFDKNDGDKKAIGIMSDDQRCSTRIVFEGADATMEKGFTFHAARRGGRSRAPQMQSGLSM